MANIPDAYFGADGGWIVEITSGWGSDRLSAKANSELNLYANDTLPGWSSLESHCLARSAAAGSRDPWNQAWLVTEDAAGWPCRALWSRRDDNWFGGLFQNAERRTFGEMPQFDPLATPSVVDLSALIERVPKRVLAVGFVADTAFWGGLLWCIIRGPGALRRWHRMKLRRCMRCGYQLATPAQPICPECGTPATTTN